MAILRGTSLPNFFFSTLDRIDRIDGAGVDTFVYGTVTESAPALSDRITDFQSALREKLDLGAIDANTNSGAGVADFRVQLDLVSSLSADNFVL